MIELADAMKGNGWRHVVTPYGAVESEPPAAVHMLIEDIQRRVHKRGTVYTLSASEEGHVRLTIGSEPALPGAGFQPRIVEVYPASQEPTEITFRGIPKRLP